MAKKWSNTSWRTWSVVASVITVVVIAASADTIVEFGDRLENLLLGIAGQREQTRSATQPAGVLQLGYPIDEIEHRRHSVE
jgi:hypothetical protein